MTGYFRFNNNFNNNITTFGIFNQLLNLSGLLYSNYYCITVHMLVFEINTTVQSLQNTSMNL